MIKVAKLIRSKRKTLALIVNHEGELIVRAPIKSSLEYIHSFINKKTSWIKQKQELAKRNKIKNGQKKFIDGEEFLFLGKKFQLKITEKYNTIKLEDFLYLPKYMLENAREHLASWYKTEAIKVITDRTNHYAKLSSLKYKKIKMSNAQKRWGSCSIHGNLNFNWRLIMAPLEIIDYVVVHELAHLKEHNHSKRFWDLVKSILPTYEAFRKWLKNSTIAMEFLD